MGSAWRGWPLKRSDLRVQGIQDVRLRDDGSRMAVIDPSYQDAGTGREGRIGLPGSLLAAGLFSIIVCRSGYVPHSRRFCCTQGQHWCIGTLAHAGGQRHRGHGGCAIGIDGLVNTQRTEIRRWTMS